MDDGYHAVGSALNAVLRALDAATQDTVNQRTPGYQKHALWTRSFETELDQELGRDAALVRTSSLTSFAQGTFVPRDDPLAVALDGPGFLAVQTPAGTAYTRNGDLMLGADGTLQTRAGYAVLGPTGPLRIFLGGGEVHIDETGMLLQGENEVGSLRLVEFENRQALERVGDTLFRAPDQAGLQPASATSVRSGHLELPPGSTVTGMVSMIAAGRAFEAAQRVARTMDDTYQRLTRQS